MYLRTINVEYCSGNTSGVRRSQDELFRVWWDIKRETEDYGIVKMSPRDLYFDPSTLYYEEYLYEYIRSYQRYGAEPDHQTYLAHIEQVSKLTWLLVQFADAYGKFAHPLGVHFEPSYDFQAPEDPSMANNPQRNQGVWRIHPGGTRSKVLYYFGDLDKPLDTLLFNTTGVPVPPTAEWILKFKNHIEFYEWWDREHDMQPSLGLVCDRGTMIPHCIPGIKPLKPGDLPRTAEDIHSVGKEEHKRIYERLQRINIVGVNFHDYVDRSIQARAGVTREIQPVKGIEKQDVLVEILDKTDKLAPMRGLVLALLEPTHRKLVQQRLNIRSVKVVDV